MSYLDLQKSTFVWTYEIAKTSNSVWTFSWLHNDYRKSLSRLLLKTFKTRLSLLVLNGLPFSNVNIRARGASQKILSRDNANKDLWQTNKHTDRQGWNSITPFLQSRGNIKHMQLSQKCLEIWLNCRDAFIYLYVDIHTSLKWRIALFLIPWMRLKRLIWKKKLKRKTKPAGISIHVIKTTGKLRASIQMLFLLCPAQSIEWICTSWCFSYLLIT